MKIVKEMLVRIISCDCNDCKRLTLFDMLMSKLQSYGWPHRWRPGRNCIPWATYSIAPFKIQSEERNIRWTARPVNTLIQCQFVISLILGDKPNITTIHCEPRPFRQICTFFYRTSLSRLRFFVPWWLLGRNQFALDG